MTPRKKDAYNSTFAVNLRKAMEEKRIKQVNLSDMTGLSRQTIGYYCNGTNIPDIEKLALIAKALDVSADWLLGLSKQTTEIPAVIKLETVTDAISLIEKITKNGVFKCSEVRDDTLTLYITNKDLADYYRQIWRARQQVNSMSHEAQEIFLPAVDALADKLKQAAQNIRLNQIELDPDELPF